MKRILALVLLAVFFSANAFAQYDQAGNRSTATFGDQDSNKNYRITADSTGLVQFANDTSIAWPYENIGSGTAVTSTAGNPGTGYQLSQSDSGLIITDYGGKTAGTSGIGKLTGQGTRYILPACTSSNLGMYYDINTAVQETITITPFSTADSIAYSISSTGLNAGQGIKNNSSEQSGDSFEIMCTSVGTWTVDDHVGTWATSS